MTPEQAGAELARLTAEFHGPPPSANPTNGAEARARLQTLTQNRQWTEKLIAGDATTKAEYESLTKMVAESDDRLKGVLDGTAAPQMMELTSPENPLSTRELQTWVDDLRAIGVPEEMIRGYATNQPITRELRAFAERRDRELRGDAAWKQRLLAGGKLERAQSAGLDILLLSPVAEG
jgi:hypothetical protein